MDPATFSILTDACRQAARAIHKTNRWLSFDDLVQEATAAALVALPKFDATRGTALGGYLYMAAFRASKRLAWNASSVVPESDRAPTLQGIARQKGMSVDDKVIGDRAAEGLTADQLLEAANRRAVVAQVVAAHLAADRHGEAVRAVLFGEMPAREAAAAFGLDVRVLYKATEKARLNLKSDRRLMELL
jgi:DNA-directed RNA polymerase specialized sigma24 family protein